MNRREIIALLGGAAMLPVTARAQQAERVRRVGVLMGGAENDVAGQAELAAFREALLKLGWIEGRNMELYVRWSGAEGEYRGVYATEIVGRSPDAILANSGTVARAVRHETAKIPIVLASGGDIVQGGLVTNLAHPEGNVTGFITIERSLAGKWLELLKALAPSAARIAVIEAPENAGNPEYWSVVQRAAQGWNVDMTKIEAGGDGQIERDFGEFAHAPNGALLVLPGVSTLAHRDAIVTAAARYRLPAIYPYPAFTTSGGLVSYGPDQIDIFRRAAAYVDRILRGELLSNLPMQLPTKFELVINLKAAKALGLSVPNSLLVAADEVIE